MSETARSSSTVAWARRALPSGVLLASAFVAILASQLVARGWPSAIVAVLAVAAASLGIDACIEGLREARASRVIAYVAHATRLGLPLPEFLRAAALAETPAARRALGRLAALMADASPLADALAEAVPELAARDVGLARAAEANGTLPSTFARLAADRVPSPDDVTVSVGLQYGDSIVRQRLPWMYVAFVFLTTNAVASMLIIFVVPKFAQIMHDFGVRPPEWMQTLAHVRSTVGIDPLSLLVLIAFFLAIGTVFANTIVGGFRRVGNVRLADPRRRATWRERLVWRLPIVGGPRRDRDRADVCQAVADGLAAHRPADVAIGDATLLAVDPTFHGRVERWRALVAAGRPLGEAARVAGMPTLVADLAGDRAAGVADTFAFLARHYRGRADRGHEWLVAFAAPLMTLIAAVPVAAIAYALFDSIRLLADAAMPKNLGM